ncbi:hypothetical protein AUQ39_00215 [Lacticaseibacillus casei]|uniref:hypothetical protein n=1 Tax=Lacticaseibacillus TaxID=2759736 RepID=UPI00095117C0|nr:MULTISPECIES: hypothetical protein [Lacticaseibacillus]MDE3283348.1 hypothetical protein [Lacticaseibacillus casei]OLS11596.1 hypothetical protein AUQ39_00215 [Lacticaseibacillus casei]QVI31506.1 hypothetical protein KG087_11385 [Lacticaseibacillus zeae]
MNYVTIAISLAGFILAMTYSVKTYKDKKHAGIYINFLLIFSGLIAAINFDANNTVSIGGIGLTLSVACVLLCMHTLYKSNSYPNNSYNYKQTAQLHASHEVAPSVFFTH